MKKLILTLIIIYSLSGTAFSQSPYRLAFDSIAIGVKPEAKINLDGSITARSFNGKRPITGSIATGQNPNTNDLIAWLNAIFYPTQVPTATLTGGANYELSATGVTKNLSWSYGRQAATDEISTASINQGIGSIFTTQPNQPGTVSGTQSVTTPANTNRTYTITVTTTDGKTATANTTDNWLPRRYWGRTSLATPDNTIILAAAGGGSELSNSRAKGAFTVTASGSNRIYYAYPASLGALTSLTIGGFDSLDAFTRSTISVTNASGYTQNYYVYVSDNTFSGNTPNIITN